LVAAADLDLSIASARVQRAVLEEPALECRVGEGVAEPGQQPAGAQIHVRLDALTPRLADILKEIAARNRARQKDDVVADVGAYSPTFQRSVASPYGVNLPRSPTSSVCATTCFRFGSPTKKLASVQGLAMLAQDNSAGVGARLATE